MSQKWRSGVSPIFRWLCQSHCICKSACFGILVKHGLNFEIFKVLYLFQFLEVRTNIRSLQDGTRHFLGKALNHIYYTKYLV